MIDIDVVGIGAFNVEAGISPLKLLKEINNNISKTAIVVRIDGNISDWRQSINNNCSLEYLTFGSELGRKAFWHSAAHIMAQAIKRVYPNAKFAIGPAIDNGFYYDIDLSEKLTNECLQVIESEMQKIVKENLPIVREEVPRTEALAYFAGQEEIYKIELIEELSDGSLIYLYRQGEFVDLCVGPHVAYTGKVKAFKLLSIAGAYWRGDAKNKMLQRIYGIAMPDKQSLSDYLQKVEEAKARDHNKVGRELEYFMTVPSIGQGLPLLMPNGAKVVQLLQRFVEDEEERRGYLLTKTPVMAKSDLYKISGHWNYYKDGMFIIPNTEKANEEEVLALRPMTCPFQFMIYKSAMRSYKDLPLRYGETSTLFRNEDSGEMHGLIRVRQFTISEGHLICTQEQLAEEFRGVVDLVNYFMTTLGFAGDISYRFSRWDARDKGKKYIDNPQAWENVEAKMRIILDELGIDYSEAVGEAAFYGPKLDIQFKNVHGKEDTLITIQIDFALPERFDMTYIDKNGDKQRPYVIHRTSVGCYERTLAMLIEKFSGAMPLWLAPCQVRILPITDRTQEYAVNLQKQLLSIGVRCEVDERSEKIGYKIRDGQVKKTPYLIVVGDKEAENKTVAIRKRGQGDIGIQDFMSFKDNLLKEIINKIIF